MNPRLRCVAATRAVADGSAPESPLTTRTSYAPPGSTPRARTVSEPIPRSLSWRPLLGRSTAPTQPGARRPRRAAPSTAAAASVRAAACSSPNSACAWTVGAAEVETRYQRRELVWVGVGDFAGSRRLGDSDPSGTSRPRPTLFVARPVSETQRRPRLGRCLGLCHRHGGKSKRRRGKHVTVNRQDPIRVQVRPPISSRR